MRRWEYLADALLRIVGIVVAAALCSFFTLDQPVIATILRALRDLIGFVGGLLGRAPLGFDPTAAALEYERSLILVFSAIAIGFALGLPLGLVAGIQPGSPVARVAAAISNLGILTPSFALGLLVMLFFVQVVLAYTGIQVITITPDQSTINLKNLIAPALTLAARPLAHVAGVVAATTREATRQDFVRVARSKGLPPGRVVIGHVLPNVLSAAVSAVDESVLFSLSSLAVIEYLFSWAGAGYGLLLAIQRRNAAQVTFLIVAIGLTVVVVSFALRLVNQRIDPRLARLAPADGGPDVG